MLNSLELFSNAENIYRTKFYIIKQQILYLYDSDGNTTIHSDDTYYLRNKKLDSLFEKTFSNRKKLNGQRIHSLTHTKTYVI